MLSNLVIKNFAIIKNTSLNFNSGFNVLIGETGAGKSIILDALNFVLGAKANKENIRSGEQQIVVKATFENLNEQTKKLLNNFLIEIDEDILIVSRTFSIDGKSICNINGETISLSMLKQIAETLVDSYEQHDGVQLLKSTNHLKILDENCPSEIETIKTEISNLLHKRTAIDKEIEQLGGTNESRARIIDLLSYQINEIESANILEGEEEDLRTQISVAANSEQLNNNLSSVISCINSSNIESCVSLMQSIVKYDDKLQEYYQRLSETIIELEDIESSLVDYKSHISFDESEIDSLNLRLDVIKNLKKKYGSAYEDIIKFLNNAKDELYKLQNCEQTIIDLNNQKQQILKKLFNLSTQLHNIRQKEATIIEKKVQDELAYLGMKKSVFKISFEQLPDCIENAHFSQNGLDNVEFLFSANLGETPKSLSKIISGGELSRFMLALKNVLNDSNSVSTLIFDEIDAGISGEIGSMVAQRITKLSKSYQILCITHLQQVTAMADNFIFVKKQIVNNATQSYSEIIEGERVLEYIATLSGQGLTEISLANAKELIAWANNIKESL